MNRTVAATPTGKPLLWLLAILASMVSVGGIGAQEMRSQGYVDADFSAQGFHVTLPQLAFALELEETVTFDTPAEAEARWNATFSRIEIIELPGVKNRYGIFVDDTGHNQYVAIRGTANFHNALLDVEFFKEKSPELEIFVHRGFETAARALYADLKPRLVHGYRLYISGHSLGAAEAQLLGMMLKVDGVAVTRIVASGPPKITDAEGWRRYADLPVVRVAAPFDPVPFLPPGGLVYDENPYIQGGPLLMILDGRAMTVVKPEFFGTLSDAFRAIGKAGKKFDIADHMVRSYAARLNEKAGGVIFVNASDWLRYATPIGAVPGTMPGTTPGVTPGTLPGITSRPRRRVRSSRFYARNALFSRKDGVRARLS
ncbi:MAG: lipase family protein [Rectinema sp.]